MAQVTLDGPTACTRQELPEMITMVDAALRAGSDQSMLTDYPLVYHDHNLKNIRRIKGDGKVVSVVPFIPRPIVLGDCHFSIGLIAPTVTHPDYRRKGYALACLYSCLQQMAQDGLELSGLWTRMATFPFYEQAHYQPVRTQVTKYLCQKQDAQLFRNYGHKVVEYNPVSQQYLADIQRIHEYETFGVLRQAEEYPSLFSLPKMKTLLALEEDTVVAYLIVSHTINKPGLIEGGGEEAALQTLLHHVLARWPDDEPIPTYAYLTPSVLGDLLERTMPERREPWPKHMMIRINQVRHFFEKIVPWLEQQGGEQMQTFSIAVTDADELISFEFTNQGLRLGDRQLQPHIPMTRQQLTSVVFGEHWARRVVIPDILADLFPVYFPIWILDQTS